MTTITLLLLDFVDGKGSSTEINYYSFTDNPQSEWR